MSPTRTPPQAPQIIVPTAAASSGDDIKGDIKLLAYKVDELKEKFDKFSADIKDNYATKVEMREVRQDVSKLEGQIGWAVKLILGLVIVAVVGLVLVKTGGAR